MELNIISLKADKRLMKMNVYIPDSKEMMFRKTVYERFGYKKGNLNKAFEQAIDLWLTNADGSNKEKKLKTSSKGDKNVDNKTKLKKQDNNNTADDIVKIDESNIENECNNLSFDELYAQYNKLKDFM
ncbi:MAG: hypothetical protein ACRD9Q_11315, partial [Nitrososphaeraceae archaeon]